MTASAKQTPRVGQPSATSGLLRVECAFDEMVDLAKLVPNPRNPNKHPDGQIALLAKVIQAQGWRSPIVVSNRSGFITKGHGRYAAAQLLRAEQAPVDFQDYASEAEEWADMVADNRLAELAEISAPELGALLRDLEASGLDMELTGFDPAALEEATGQFAVEGAAAPELADGDRAPFQQMTFTVHDDQAGTIKAALALAADQGGDLSPVNENSNGNSLAWICADFIKEHGKR